MSTDDRSALDASRAYQLVCFTRWLAAATLGDKLATSGQGAAAGSKYTAAAGKFMIPAQFFDDDEITPESLDKAAVALEKSGQAAKAGEFRKLLKDKYPSYSR